MNRNTFLRNAAILFSGHLLGCKAIPNPSIKNEVISFDLHTHPGRFFQKGLEGYVGDSPFTKRIMDMQTHHLNGAFFSIVADMPLLKVTENGIVPSRKYKDGEGWLEFERQLHDLKTLLAEHKIEIAYTANELTPECSTKAFIACEGGDFLDNKIENVAKCYKKGVRSIQLVHYAPNTLGDLQTWKADYGGLSLFGKEVVKEMNKLSMVIDVAHASVRTVKAVTDLTDAPIILSHSILKDGQHKPIAARAISKDHAQLVANTGGLIGMWPSGFSASIDEFVQHTFRMIDAVGIDHVGIGTDMDGNYKPIISDYKEFTDWKTALVNKGLSKEEVGKIVGGNSKRVLSEVLK